MAAIATAAIADIVVLKGGPSINGAVLVPQFALATPYGTLKFKKTDILAVEYKNPPYADSDQVQVDAGTRLSGELGPAVIKVRLQATGQVIAIPKTDIHSLVFFTRRQRLSRATRDALKRAA